MSDGELTTPASIAALSELDLTPLIRALITTLAFAFIVKHVLHFRSSPLPERAGNYLAALGVLLASVSLTWWLSNSVVIRLAVALVALLCYGTLLLTRVMSTDERNWIQGSIKRFRVSQILGRQE